MRVTVPPRLARLWLGICLATLLAGCGAGPSGPGPTESCTGYPDWQTSPYVVPYPVGASYRVAQGNCSGGGHSGVYKYSYDFDMPIGSPVTAAREGVVYEIRTGHVDGDLTPGHENFVKILHPDGRISAYPHLSTDGVLVAVGQVVKAGDLIGLSGNTGQTGGFRHLHFHVSTCSEPVDCGTVPVTFRNVGPDPVGLLVDHVYLAMPYDSGGGE
jgi:murein DD-endopeptidase MepM/ murein hydrolase activator NlpD